ncbi:MAG: endonuclease domain-containing protein [Gammaproteobacteria bacterium]|nr:endonuclease domain-containing protein [Gammaproteobacteria bacterium]
MQRIIKAENVLNFINKCAEDVGNVKMDTFSYGIHSICLDYEIESPIEQMLLCALKSVAYFNSIHEAEPYDFNGETYLDGLSIYPQVKIGRYRCDFEVGYNIVKRNCIQECKAVLVECDSQQFHERNESERRYEKMRDRYFISKGYKTFHFTGSEIVKNPLDVAVEIISYVMDEPIADLLKGTS